MAASDCDLGTNAVIEYRVVGGKHRALHSQLSLLIFLVCTCVEDAFEATPEGHIRTTTTLDRETVDVYQFTVMSMDQGVPFLTHTTLVEVTVTDINDNTPIIMPFLSITEVTEVIVMSWKPVSCICGC